MTNVQSVSRIKRPDRGVILTAVILVLIYALVFVLEQILPPTSMLFTVLKKGATYALVAVSMNLLNGFTGLFSLGQAGFMLIGAYTYGILTIPVAQRAGGAAPACHPEEKAIKTHGGHGLGRAWSQANKATRSG